MKEIGTRIAEKRRRLGLTQQVLAERLGVSFQAVSKWETGITAPDIALLPSLAEVLDTSVDALLGVRPGARTRYEEKYRNESFYWGTTPNRLCYVILRLLPPTKPRYVLDIGCGEGKDAVFLARNGYHVTGFDLTESGVEKARAMADACGVEAEFFQADLREYRADTAFDVVFSSGVLHYLRPEERLALISRWKEHTVPGGIHVLNVFVTKPFIPPAPDLEARERETPPWHSGELMGYYHDWRFRLVEETIFDCTSGGVPHQHCMDVLIAEKPEK